MENYSRYYTGVRRRIVEPEYETDYPCDTCGKAEYCDGWEAQFCCDLCEYMGGGDCENCDPMDI